MIATQQHFSSQAIGDLSAQSNTGAGHRVQPSSDLGDTKDGVLCPYPDIGTLQNFSATGEGITLDRQYQRFIGAVIPQQRLPVHVRHFAHHFHEFLG